MKQLYKHHLFQRHLFVSDADSSGTDQFETMYTLANLFSIQITEGADLLSPEMIRLASGELGENVPTPFYPGFPESVRELTADQLFFDQLLHYAATYGLGDFSSGKKSIFDPGVKRPESQEPGSLRKFTVIPEANAVKRLHSIVSNLLAGTRPLSEEQFELTVNFLRDYNITMKHIASKDTAVRLTLALRTTEYVSFLSMPDVIRMVDRLNCSEYENRNMKKLNLRNQDRKFIISVMDELFRLGKMELRSCFEKKKLWNGLLHHIHYHAKTPEAIEFVDAMRGKDNRSVYSDFEAGMARGHIREAADILLKEKGSGALLRNLDYLVSRCRSDEDMEYILNLTDSKNVILLCQLLIRYGLEPGHPRTFRFVKHNRLRVHPESKWEQEHRRSALSAEQTSILREKVLSNLKAVLANRLGKVYIDPDMVRYALPLQESASQGGFGVLTRGTRLPIPEGNTIRGFTYWEKVDDIDLSAFGITEDGRQIEFSWRTMASKQSKAITYSGDVTNGYDGGSEYFDVNLKVFREQFPEVRYIIFCDNVFTRLPFSRCICRAGYMLRRKPNSGEIFEPKTVESAFRIDCDSTFAYLFGIDLTKREFIWLNMARNGSETVAGETGLYFLTDYFRTTEAINLHTFFEMMAAEITDCPEDAEVIVTDKPLMTKKGQTLIREYDIDHIIALMNQ